jgi:ribosomal protein S18 acetylase RimI-like enzyme
MTIEVFQLQQDEWKRYKDIRLRALSESPNSFGRSYEDEILFDDDIWKDRLVTAQVFAAEFESNLVGLVSLVQKQDSDTFYIGSMWVDPKFRNEQIGTLLLDKLIHTAKDKNAVEIRGGCMKTNLAALRFYERHGFVLTGNELPIEKDTNLKELEICLSLEP